MPAADQPAAAAGRRHAGDGRQLLSDPGVQAGDLVVDGVDEPQVGGDLEGVDLAEPAGESSGQLRRGGPEPPVGGDSLVSMAPVRACLVTSLWPGNRLYGE